MNVYLTRSLASEAFQFQRKQYVVCFVLFCCSLSPSQHYTYSTCFSLCFFTSLHPAIPTLTITISSSIQHHAASLFLLFSLSFNSETEEMKISSHSTLNRTWNKFSALLLQPSTLERKTIFRLIPFHFRRTVCC